jgi:hypothetical protein
VRGRRRVAGRPRRARGAAMILVEAHVAGVPVEETLLQLLPAGGAMLAALHLGLRRARRKLARRRTRTGASRGADGAAP